MQSKAISFLREIREMVFLQKKNIAKRAHLVAAAGKIGLDVAQFEFDLEDKAKEFFLEDLRLAKEMGERGFPSLFFSDYNGNTEFVYGTKPYAFYEIAVLKLAPEARKKEYQKHWDALFSKYQTLTAKEFAELSGAPRVESEQVLDELAIKGNLVKMNTKNGALWKLQGKS